MPAPAVQSPSPAVPGEQSVAGDQQPTPEKTYSKAELEAEIDRRFGGKAKEFDRERSSLQARIDALEAADRARAEEIRKGELAKQGKHEELLAEERKAREAAEARAVAAEEAKVKADADAAVLRAEKETQIANRKNALKTRFEALPEKFRGAIGPLLELPAAYDSVEALLSQQEALAGVQVRAAGAVFSGQPRPGALPQTSGDPQAEANQKMAAAFDYSKRA